MGFYKRETYYHGLNWFCLGRAAPMRVHSQMVNLPETSYGPLWTYKKEDKLEETFNSESHK